MSEDGKATVCEGRRVGPGDPFWTVSGGKVHTHACDQVVAKASWPCYTFLREGGAVYDAFECYAAKQHALDCLAEIRAYHERALADARANS